MSHVQDSQVLEMSVEEKRALLKKLLAAREQTPADTTYPLSFSQNRIWFQTQLEKNAAGYNMKFALQLNGRLSLDVLAQSIAEVVRRHEVLRTVFRTIDEQPVQLVRDTVDIPLTRVDLYGCDAATVAARIKEETLQPFDIAEGPLLRTKVLALSDTAHIFLLTMHHIITDGISMSIFAREVMTLYKAFDQGLPSPLPMPVQQYGAFAREQAETLAGEALDQQLAFWTDHLTGAPPLIDLPTDRPRPPVQHFRGKRFYFDLRPGLMAQVRELSRKTRATPFMTLRAAYAAFLARYCGIDDLVIGSPNANRMRAETREMIGFFVNEMPLRTQLADDPCFTDLVARTRAAIREAQVHGDLPFDRLVKELRPERRLDANPIFQVGFALHNAADWSLDLPDLEIVPRDTEQETAKSDLNLALIQQGDHLKGFFDYNTDLFDETTITRMVGYLDTFLAGLFHHPEAPISTHTLLSEAERAAQVNRYPVTADPEDGATVLDLFQQQAAAHPEHEAVCQTRNGTPTAWTYAAFHRAVNKLANLLEAHGVSAEMPVGVCLEKGPDAVMAMMAVLRAGGVYVPLDPAHPRDRLAYVLADSGLGTLITTSKEIAAFDANDVQFLDVVSLDEHPAEDESDVRNAAPVLPDQLAYLIYTSGSTGRPKGTGIAHRGLANMVREQIAMFALHPRGRTLQVASLSFDASISEILTTLCSGAALVLPDPDQYMLGEQLAQHLQGITHVTLVPSALSSLPGGLPRSVETLISAGEACTPALRARFAGSTRFLNAYGPTEASVCVTMAHLRDDGGPIHIGRPIARTRVFILDRRLEPVPEGLMGELYIEGSGLARGYHDQPKTTAACFLPHPFSAVPGARLYRSGDLCRFLSDGAVAYVGRVDHQVKLRGYRIELAEIEHNLTAHPSVAEALVVLRGEHENKVIQAYFRKADETTDDTSLAQSLRDHLSARLPEYMIPAGFTPLEHFPRTPNGKVDLHALPEPGKAGLALSDAFAPPENATQEQVRDIWKSVIEGDHIGIDDNFFQLGGHSLAAVQVAGRLQEVFGVEVEVTDLFEHTTIRAQALFVGKDTSRQPDFSDHEARGRKKKEAMRQRRNRRTD